MLTKEQKEAYLEYSDRLWQLSVAIRRIKSEYTPKHGFYGTPDEFAFSIVVLEDEVKLMCKRAIAYSKKGETK